MRLFAILALVVGLVLAGSAVYFAADRFRELEALAASRSSAPQVELVEVAVVLKDLHYGDILTPDVVAMAPWPKISQPATAFVTVESLFGTPGTRPRSVLRTMEPGEPILASKVTDFGQPAGIAQRLSQGMRAFTIGVDVSTGVSGFLTTNDKVDVFWSGSDAGRPLTKLILDNVPLIAIDQKADEDRGKAVVARTVTVEVSPEHVALLAQASATGRLSLSLRGTKDTASTGTVEVDQTAIVGREAVVEERPVEVVPTVRVRKGTEASDVPTK